ncbi:MAG: alkaline phosphatase family protein [Phycisphaerae bacterium]
MAKRHLIFMSVAGLRPIDVDPAVPTLYGWAASGVTAELVPTFPCVTSCVQASIATGVAPGQHGIIANGFHHRDRGCVEFWVGRNDAVAGRQIWDAIKQQHPDWTSAVWHLQNIKGAGADFIVTPAPIHADDGTTRPWCYSKPDGLYQRLIDAVGHFPLQHYWGPQAGIESTRWILRASAWLVDNHAPNYNWIYIPHLDYAGQRFGQDSPQYRLALTELDGQLADFTRHIARSSIGHDVTYLVAGEYALTDVTGVVYPNRMLRDAGLLKVIKDGGAEQIDIRGSAAFAMVDHQLAHVYARDADPRTISLCCELFNGAPGLAGVYHGDALDDLGVRHERCGDVLLVSDDCHWFAYYWWLDDAAAPSFARTVDIHRKPGYDPVELFLDPSTGGIPLDAGLVKGSHGVPATGDRHRTTLVCSRRCEAIEAGRVYRDTDLKRISLDLMDSSAPAGL